MTTLLSIVINPLPLETVECHICEKEIKEHSALQDEDNGLFFCSSDCATQYEAEEYPFVEEDEYA